MVLADVPAAAAGVAAVVKVAAAAEAVVPAQAAQEGNRVIQQHQAEHAPALIVEIQVSIPEPT